MEDGTGNAGNITIETEKLTLNEGAQINADTFGVGDGGNLFINAAESIELIGSIDLSSDNITASSLFTNVGEEPTATGNGGNIIINTPRLVVRDGAQIGTTAQNEGNGGTITIKNAESILLSGTSPLAKFGGEGRSGITINAEPSLTDEQSGAIIFTTGNGGTLNLNSKELVIEKGAFISADTFSLGKGGNANINVNRLILRDGGRIGAGSLFGVDSPDRERGAGGTLNINANESIEVIGTGEINGETVPSSIFTLAESTGDAGDLTLTTNNLTVQDGGEINASATGTGAAGNLTMTVNNINLNNGSLTVATAAGEGGNIKLEIADNLTLRNNSLISARAFEAANGGNINIDAEFVIAFPSQNDGNDILASASEGRGGNININAQALFGLEERPQNPFTNDIDASSQFGLDGNVSINTPDVDATQGATELPENIVEPETLTTQACNPSKVAEDILADRESGLIIKGRGGLPRQPTDPLTADVIHIEGRNVEAGSREQGAEEVETFQGTSLQGVEEEEEEEEEKFVIVTERTEDINPDDIVPARGMIVKENGDIILTGYPTPNVVPRTPTGSANCGSLKEKY